MSPQPTIGRVVIYRTDGRNGLAYDLPAIVTCTQDTHPGDYPNGRANPLPVPSSPRHVHLTVFTPGGFGTKVVGGGGLHEPRDDSEFVGAAGFEPGSGTYVELDVPEDEVRDAEVPHRTWRWPVIT